MRLDTDPSERFRRGPVIGRGGTGMVYRAWDDQLRCDVALKSLHGLDPDALYNLKREFRVLSGIVHPNLVQLHELVSDGAGCFFTMELVDGLDLVEHIRGEAPAGAAPRATEEEIARLFAQLVSGVAAVHAAGRMHRDIKPSNVMVSRDGRVVLLDFGFAAILTSSVLDSQTSLVAGTIAYMAPEQAWGQLSTAADWYSVGTMLFEAVAGRSPFSGTVGEVLLRKRSEPPPRLRDVAPHAPTALDDLAWRLMQPSPWDRPAPDELLEILERLGAQATPRTNSLPPELPFVGRSPEAESLQSALVAVARHEPVLIEIVGPSGIGKTELVRRFLAEAERGRRALVLAGRCHPQETVPYKALDGLVDDLSLHLLRLPDDVAASLVPPGVGPLLRLFPVLGRVAAFARAGGGAQPEQPHELRRVGVRALRVVFDRLSERVPLALWIDDLQWGDLDSVELLFDLLRPPAAPGLLVLLTYRAEDRAQSPPLRALDAATRGDLAPFTRTLDLRPLSPGEVRELAGRIAGEDAKDLLAVIEAEAGGSPFIVGELARYAMTEGGLRADVHVGEAIAWRVDKLTADERALLETAALSAAPLDAQTALEVAGIDDARRPLLYRLRDGCFLRTVQAEVGELVEPYHDQIRKLLLSRLGDARKKDLHRRLADAFARHPRANAKVLLEHSLGAGDIPAACRHALAAAEQAEATLAFGAAADLYQLTLELRGDQADVALQARLGEALQNAGRCVEAATWFERAAASEAARDPASPTVDTMLRRAAEQYIHTGRMEEGIALLTRVLDAAGFRFPQSPQAAVRSALVSRVRFLLRGADYRLRDARDLEPARMQRLDALWGASTAFAMVSYPRSDALGLQHLHLALELGEPSRICRALGYEAAAESTLGRAWVLRRCNQLLDRTAGLAALTGKPYDLAWTCLCEATVRWMFADWRGCAEAARTGEAILRSSCRGVDWELAVLHMYQLSALVFLGDLREVRSRAQEGLEDARRRSDRFAANVFRLGEPAVAAITGGDAAAVLRDADEAIAAWPVEGFSTQHYHHLVATTQALLYLGRPWEAWERLERAWPELTRAQLLLIQCCRGELLHLRARVAIACASAGGAGLTTWPRKKLLAHARKDGAAIASASMIGWSAALSAHILGTVAAADGDPEGARTHLQDALGGYGRLGMEVHRLAVAHRIGRLQGIEGMPDVAKAEQALRDRGVADPERALDLFAPWAP